MWAIIQKFVIQGGLSLLTTLWADHKSTLIRLGVGAAVSWALTAGGCSLTAKWSMAWAKRQAYRQGYKEGQATCEEPKEQRRWRLFTPGHETDELPTLGVWYGINEPICIDGETIEFPSPTRASK